MKQEFQIAKWCHRFIREAVREGDICIDATAGNGNDTEFLCSLAGHTGKVYAFDIQSQALETTRKRLFEKGCTAQLILPGGDHEKTTKSQTSIVAIGKGLEMLKKDGLMCLCIYSGGDSGFAEKDAILKYLATLDAQKYLVIVSHYYNRPNHPPIPVLIKKLL